MRTIGFKSLFLNELTPLSWLNHPQELFILWVFDFTDSFSGYGHHFEKITQFSFQQTHGGDNL